MSATTEKSRWAPAAGQLEAVRERLLAKHVDEEIGWTCCNANGCFDYCLVKVRHKDGRVVALDGDDTIHKNMAREDAYCDPNDIRTMMHQKRPCVRGRGWRQELYSPQRLLHPVKRDGERGSRSFKRITWEEAYDTIAEKYAATRETYGPYSIWSDGLLGYSYDFFGQHMEGGALGGWASDSFEPHDFADTVLWGDALNLMTVATGIFSGGSDEATLFDSKLIILWGVDVVLNYPEYGYYLMLAKEKGIPIIMIEPRKTWTAHLANQWIPIRPGTDNAMMEAMAWVMLREGCYNKEFVEKWVEPRGFHRWQQYLFGSEDGIEKSPEWAEKICGVPAETIRALARLYGTSHPVYFRLVWAAARRLRGEDVARTQGYLMALGGNIGHKGTAGSTNEWANKAHISLPQTPMSMPPAHGVKCLLEAELWHHAIHLHEKLERGEISEEFYKAEIGCPQNEQAPNIKMLMFLWNPRNLAVNYYGANSRIEAIKKVDFFAYGHFNMEHTSCWYADILLPYSHQYFEGEQMELSPFRAPFMGKNNNYVIGHQQILKPAGDTRYRNFVLKEIGNRLGLGDVLYPGKADLNHDEWMESFEQESKEAYEQWVETPEIKALNPPHTWEEFKKAPIIRKPVDDYFVAHRENFEDNIRLKTASGKIEFYSDFIASGQYRHKRYDVKTFGNGRINALAKYERTPEDMFDPKVRKYPLYMITPHSFFKQHFAQNENRWFRDEWRPSIWISAADARARNIKDGDRVVAESDVGQCIVTAYVTSRMTPGVTCLLFGRNYEPSNVKTEKMPGGINTIGSCNFLIPDDHHDCRRGALLCNGLIDIQKLDVAGPYDTVIR